MTANVNVNVNVKHFQPSTYINVSIAEGGHILVALQMPRLFTPPPSPPEYLIGFARITQVVLGGRGEQLLHLLHTGYATGDPCQYRHK